MDRPASVTCSRRYSITLGDAPTVFSLKSSRSFPARPPVGGLYAAIFSTASRGCKTPGGNSIFLAAKPHLHAPRMCFQAFGACQGCDHRGQLAQTVVGECLHGYYLDEIGRGKTTAKSGRPGGWKNMIGPRSVVTRRFWTVRSDKNASRVLDLRQQALVIDGQMFMS